MPKFDVAIMNPPYARSLHLEILEKVIPEAEEVINISPIRWLQDPLAKYKKNSDYNKFENSISKHISDLKIVEFDESSEMFNTRQETQLGIIYCNKNGGFDYKIKNNTTIEKVLEKTKTFLNSKLEHDSIDGWRVRLNDLKPLNAGSGGKIGTAGYYNKFELLHHTKSFIFKDGYRDGKFWTEFNGTSGCKVFKEGDKFSLSLKFDSEEEALNFENSTKTTFYRFVLSRLKINSHTPWNGLPYMQDYSKPWTNEDFCKYFNITGFISDTEAEPGSEWEEILNAIKKFDKTVS